MSDSAGKNSKIIFSPQLANYLLAKGYTIIKLKPKHDNPTESVFVFAIDDGFYEAIDEWRFNNVSES